MSLKIRLARIGSKGKPLYRIVVSPARSKRGGKSVDILGFYNPQVNPPLLKIDERKYQEWLKFGAQPSNGLQRILNEKTA